MSHRNEQKSGMSWANQASVPMPSPATSQVLDGRPKKNLPSGHNPLPRRAGMFANSVPSAPGKPQSGAHGLAHHSSTRTPRALSIDHDRKRRRKLCPSSGSPETDVVPAVTFSRTVSPTVSDLMRNVVDGTVEPSANLYVRFARKSSSLIVPDRISVSITSSGM